MPSFFKRNNKEKDQKLKRQKQKESLESSLTVNLEQLKKRSGNSSDMVIRHLEIGKNPGIDVAVVYIDGIVNADTIDDFIQNSMLPYNGGMRSGQKGVMEFLMKKVVSLGQVNEVDAWDVLLQSLVEGKTIIFADGANVALTADTTGGDKRGVEEPTTQVTIRGPRDGFTESIRTNTALVRRRIRNPDLRIESMKIGRATNTSVEIMYIAGIVKEKTVGEVRSRLKKIKIDSILETGYIEQLVEDQPFTTFPTVYHTERPDVVAGNLLEGRVAIFVDGTPFVLLVPALFVQFFQSAEDYYARFDIASAIRFLRVLMFLLSLLAPALYIAVTTFHQEMIPTQLLIIIAAQRESVPFPAFFEAMIMEITFEILREAGVRMPRAVGSAISIVGALVIGQAAIQAGIVSPAMVIVVSITAIASFATPSSAMAISARLIRFGFMACATFFGIYGILTAFIIMIVHLCSLRSFGVPYMMPLAPAITTGLKDTVIRAPLWLLRERPRLFNKNTLQVGKNQRPKPPASRNIDNSTSERDDSND